MSADVNPGEFYRTARERIVGLVSTPGVDPNKVVPATPEWTVHDVLAHVAGVARDAVTGNMEGAPQDHWTAAQVERCKSLSIDALVAQWAQDGPILDQVFGGANGGMMSAGVFDVHSHEADLRQALGLPLAIPADFLAWAVPQMCDGFHAAVEADALPAVQLDISEIEWFRGRLGRRSEAEVRAYPWPTDPTPYLDAFFIFGRAAVSLGEVA
jgi:uncharacterized protein (TIGR03083 family)